MQRERTLPVGPSIGDPLKPVVEEQNELLESKPGRHALVQRHLWISSAGVGLEVVGGDASNERENCVEAIAVESRELLDTHHRVDYVRQSCVQ